MLYRAIHAFTLILHDFSPPADADADAATPRRCHADDLPMMPYAKPPLAAYAILPAASRRC